MASPYQHCGADVSDAPQLVCEAYDHIEIPEIKPDVTRVTLHGGVCPRCAGKFRAVVAQNSEKPRKAGDFRARAIPSQA